jgi:hypothetical protein
MSEEDKESIVRTIKDIELINLWKIGVLLFEIAFHSTPFPIDYLAFCIKNKQKFILHLP